MTDLFRETIISFFEDEGINEFEFVRRRKHPAVRVTHGGVTHLHAFAGMPSDHRSLLNTIRDLRHHLGLVGASKAKTAISPLRKRRGAKCVAAPSRFRHPDPAPEATEDKFYSRLAAIKAELFAEAAVEVSEAKGQVRRQRLRCPFLGHGVRYQEIADLRATPRSTTSVGH